MTTIDEQVNIIDEELDAFIDRHEREPVSLEAYNTQHDLRAEWVHGQLNPYRLDFYECKMWEYWGRE